MDAATIVGLLAEPNRRRVFAALVLGALPAQEAKRRLVLDRVAQSFEPGRRYPERDVDAMLATWTTGADVDRVTLRRFLVDDGFLDRADSEYWRAGGRVDV